MDLNDVKQLGLSALYESVESDVLTDAADKVEDLLGESWLNSNNRRALTALLLQIQVKIYALQYLRDGYSEEDYEQLLGTIESMLTFARAESSEKMETLSKRLKSTFEAIGRIMSDAALLASRVRDGNGNRITANVGEAREVRDLFARKIESVAKLSEVPPFGEYVFLDIKELLVRDLEEIRALAARVVNDLEVADAKRLLNEMITPVPEEFSSYEYCPVIAEREHAYAGTVVVCTPFADELELFAWSYSKKQGCELAIVDAAALNGKDAHAVELLFSTVSKAGQCLLFCGMERYRGDSRFLYQKILTFGKTCGKKVFVMDGYGDKRIYNEMMAYIRSDSSFTLMDAAFVFLGMPSYAELTELLDKSGMLEAKDSREKVKKYLPFMGFVGLNRAFAARLLGRDWLEAGRRVSEERHADALKYLSLLPTQSLLLDIDWGDFGSPHARTERVRPEIDYDSIRDVNPENIKKIMQGDFTIFERCGLLCRYCLTHGEDVSVWQSLPERELEKRLTLATRLVSRALGIELEPLITVHEEIPGYPNAWGLCVGGGKEILFKRVGLHDPGDTLETICHECYHSFQHMATESDFCEWYWRELGVTRGRIKNWLENQKRYFSPADKELGDNAMAVYRAQVVESEARAFATDCLLNSEAVIDQIEWE